MLMITRHRERAVPDRCAASFAAGQTSVGQVELRHA